MTRLAQGARSGAGTNLTRWSAVMAAGTLVSRATGFARNVVIAAALGVAGVANAYNVGNSLPNILYDLLLGGMLSAVIVPVLVESAVQDEDGGQRFAQSLLTVTAFGLAVTSAIAVLAAPLIVHLYLVNSTPAVRSLAVTFARYFLPQIFFYGTGAVAGAILNVRNRFAEPMWTPVLNNLTVVAVGVAFLVVVGRAEVAGGRLTNGATTLLGVGTTAGIVVQTLAMLPGLRRVGFRFRPRVVLTARMRRAVRLSGWVVLYVLTNQVALLVVINLASAVRVASAGYSTYLYAYTLFQLPFALVSVSVATALLPRMSAGAVVADLTALRGDVSLGLRLTGALLVPAAALLVVLGPTVATLVFGYGNTSVVDARLIGFALSGFAVGLVPFSGFQLQLRAFYALQDTRTPTVVNLYATVLNVVLDVVFYVALPSRWRVVGLALGFGLSYVLALVLSTLRLLRRLRGARGLRIVRSYVRLGFAACCGAVLALAVEVPVDVYLGEGRLPALLALAVGGLLGLAVYLRVASVVQAAEINEAVGLLRRRLLRLPRHGR